MKTKIKSYVAGLLTAVLLLGIGSLVYANTVNRNITFGIRINLYGQLMELDADSQPFVMDGRTFLPVRALAEALDLPVDFDPNTNTVYLGNRFAGVSRPLQTVAPFFDSGRTGATGNVGNSDALASNTVVMSGVQHSNAITFRSSHTNIASNAPNGAFTLHNLDGQHRFFTGQVGRIDGGGMMNATIEFRGDGRLLQTIELSATDMPIEFEVFVEGVRQLRIDVNFPSHSRGTNNRVSYGVVGFLE